MAPCRHTCAGSSGDRSSAVIAVLRFIAPLAAAVALLGCVADSSPAPIARSNPAPSGSRLRIQETRFVDSTGKDFEWRGITAFRLVDYIADGQEGEAEKFLAWAGSERLTVVRVLTMMAGQFDLKPADGRRALPRVLELAAKHGLHVEVVAFAGTADIPVDLQEHVDAIGKILLQHPNGLLEVANEPVHPSQSAQVQNPDVLKGLATRVSRDIPISLGSIERGDGFGAGSYITWHSPRESGREGWSHVLALAQGAELIARWQKPVISDEPIGAGPQFQPGRRDNSPARFRAAAVLTRLVGLGATFHYEAGLQARVPEGIELECFRAWNEAWTLLPPDVQRTGVFRRTGGAGSIVVLNDGTRAIDAFERSDNNRGWILVLGAADAKIGIADGWKVVEERRIDGGRLITVARATD